jgi:tetratricopeptide (TPR) repeat protein
VEFRLLVPRQLPAQPRMFTGRAGELAQLTTAMGNGADPGLVVISAISGTGGLGKTWLALHWAYQHLDRFPDGQLWVNLRGFDPAGEPVPAQTAVRGFLDALGVDPAVVPAEPEAAVGLYRSLVADKRMLVVLDNAASTSQVIPLLPGGAGCTVLVTSRRKLTGLVTGHGAGQLDLDVLPGAEARELLARHLGAGRLAGEPAAVAELLASCAGLPLALGITAARAAAHPGFPLAMLAAELREAATRLDALEAGDAAASVRAALSWSYHALDPRAATVLGLLGLAPGPDISLPATASLTALAPPLARTTLRELEAASLVRQDQPDRYRMHDLVRLHAAERASTDQPPALRTAALERLTSFYLHTAVAADRLLAPHRPPIDLGPPAAGCTAHELPGAAAALAWFGTEHASLLAVQRLTVAQGWHTYTWQLAWALNTFQLFRGHLREQVASWRAGLAAAQRLGQQQTQAMAHRLLGDACSFAGQQAEALNHLNRAIGLAEHAGDTGGQAHGYRTLGRAWELRGDYGQAVAAASRALELFRDLGEPVWEALALNNVGWYHAHLGRLGEARACCEAALRLYRRHRNREGEAATLDSLGYIALHDGDHGQAVHYYRLAGAYYHEAGHAYGEADALDSLAGAHTARADHRAARRALHRALALYQAQHRVADADRTQRKLAALGHAASPVDS